ncbi:hypothetical protein AB6G29_03900 [Providencia hangzhouensis]|uniref:hypothetical protein n=1 Tax=Providencia hangzhouensis TaxID=3031799 RepID=UPI0034DDA2D1
MKTSTNYYLERPSVVLPETPGFKDFPTDTIRNNPHFENMIGQLRDNMSSMNNSMDSFEDKYSIPWMQVYLNLVIVVILLEDLLVLINI